MAAKRGGGLRRGCRGQRGVIPALEAADAFWIWTTKMHVAKGGRKQEDGSVFLAAGAAIAVMETSPGDGKVNDNVK
jgi:hypothetical protein